jgi:hydroxypyruvate reductase
MTERVEGPDPRDLLRACFDAGVAAVEPSQCMPAALDRTEVPSGVPAILAIGKAAPGMASALVAWMGTHGVAARHGLIVTEAPSHRPPFPEVIGDHPVPGARSAAASDAIGEFIDGLEPGQPVHVALSGGGSALIAAPLAPVTGAEMIEAFSQLLGSGLPIGAMNAVRKRITRWSAGRLAVALGDRQVHGWIISDVAGDDPATIASGPLTVDRWTTEAIMREVRHTGLTERLPASIRAALKLPPPAADTPALQRVQQVIVASNADAVAAAVRSAVRRGRTATAAPAPLAGEAAAMGVAIARDIARLPTGQVIVWGGETVVTLGVGHGVGGRSQELALAASVELQRLGSRGSVLAAGTDGRDGPTDAAGALVDATTAASLAAAGVDLADVLRRHDVTQALDRAGALIRMPPTGTNVMDLVVAVSG